MRLLLFVFITAAFFAPPARAAEQVYYRASEQEIGLAARDVASAFGLDVESENLPAGQIDGVFVISHPHDFFRRLAKKHELDWFALESTVYLSAIAARQTQEFVFDTIETRRQFLVFLRRRQPAGSERFALEESPPPAARLRVAAPGFYLSYVRELYSQYTDGGPHGASAGLHASGAGEQAVMIFPLKHAWAADKDYQFSQGAWTVPGVASLLRRLLAGGDEEEKPALAASSLTPAPRLGSSPPATPATPASPAAPPAQTAVSILPDPRLNAVLVRDDPALHGYYQNLIEALDRRAPLVEIEAIIVDVAKNRISDLGINWQANKGRDSIGYGETPAAEGAAGTFGLSLGLGALGSSVIADARGLLARIQFLETKGESRIVSRPSVLTMDNLEAVIDASEKFFVRIQGFQDTSLYPVETGTTMRVTPHVIPSAGSRQDIQLFVRIEDGSVDNSEQAQVDELPRVQNNQVHTQAVISENSSLLVGGHIHTVSSRSVSAVPILGHIPLLGWLFRSENRIEREFVRLFIIRPRLHADER